MSAEPRISAGRVIVRAAICSLGLWTAVAAFLTHHPVAGWIGVGLMVLGAVLLFTAPAYQEPME